MTKKLVFALIVISIALTACSQSKPKPSLTITEPKPKPNYNPLPFYDHPKKLASGYRFTEGPAPDGQGNIYFSDIPNSRIHFWQFNESVSTFRENSGKANGLFIDKDGNLLACEGGNQRVSSTDPDGNVTIIADKYNDKPFNSPNDLWPDNKGGVYFTDPRYGNRQELPQNGEHVYYITPEKKVIRVIDDMVRPNGIVGTPDGKILYVADHGDNKTFRYDINPDGTLTEKTLFAESGSDGMTIDTNGNVYLTAAAVKVYNAEGKHLQSLQLSETPSNLAFAGPNRKKLFITARTSVYIISTKTTGAY